MTLSLYLGLKLQISCIADLQLADDWFIGNTNLQPSPTILSRSSFPQNMYHAIRYKPTTALPCCPETCIKQSSINQQLHYHAAQKHVLCNQVLTNTCTTMLPRNMYYAIKYKPMSVLLCCPETCIMQLSITQYLHYRADLFL